MGEMAGKDYVITVHGIWTAGKWQQDIAYVYAPHFECISVTYPQYRWLGPLDLVSEPPILALALAAWIIVHRLGYSTPRQILVCLPLLMGAYLASYYKRKRAFDVLLKQASPYVQVGQRTHIIAHSLGTYLIGRALSERHDFQAGRIVLVGCVLPVGFPWERFRAVGLNDALLKYVAVRNELATKDYVVWIAWIVSPIIRGLGRAGLAGFDQASGLVHNLIDPRGSCTKCQEKEGMIHNVTSDLGHSDTFVNSGYAETFWLPFLWGIDPAEYADFIRFCNLAASLEREWTPVSRRVGHVDSRLIKIEKELRGRSWKFTNGTFEDFVLAEVLSRYPKPAKTDELESLMASAVHGTWLAVMEGMKARQEREERRRSGQQRNLVAEDAIAWLNPFLAVRRAVQLL
jgi:hypothetical protein